MVLQYKTQSIPALGVCIVLRICYAVQESYKAKGPLRPSQTDSPYLMFLLNRIYKKGSQLLWGGSGPVPANHD